MFLRRSAVALAATALLCAAAAPVALADGSPSPQKRLPTGLYGEGDPQYDGVWRQSVALLAQHATGVTPAKKAVTWLAGQQCEDGSFVSYRADSGKPCDAKTPGDTNATAVAVQALATADGHQDAVKTSVNWLKTVQNEDGGWSYNPGGPSDANSTAVVIGALAAAGQQLEKARSAKGDNSPLHALTGLQLGCDAKAGERGAFAYQPGEKGELAPNDAATVAAALAALGRGLDVAPAEEKDRKDTSVIPAPSCRDDGTYVLKDSARAAARYLSSALEKNGQYLKAPAMPGAEDEGSEGDQGNQGDQPDYGNTALAVLALAAGEHPGAAQKPLNWLEKNFTKWDKSKNDPAALGQLVLAVNAAGADPASFGGVNLVDRLNATGPTPAATPDSAQADEHENDDPAPAVWWIIGVGVVAGVGIGLLLSMRNKKKQGS
ncbi:prenyltransferase/squalene oxidase repeat-containing protein [Streptomyces gobiensis]|uniref:prenyltransferase/squalene oxidase repeat-containing protein n=1 Tax=Streptomyces gobiensis TaxID=2875706 RepID=UPI001E632625|nr:prenyltransferase/squalene oxidase repeat-containing protein [Streptomyces gobiensis]UGY91139.1 terpene cyclase/mutase family protein [Streptomyces gobiensis]